MATAGKPNGGNDDNVDDRIEELKRRATELSGGEMRFWEAEGDCPPEVLEAFWKQVVAYEEGPFTTALAMLAEAGIEVPDPEALDDTTLACKLWEVINELARMRIFISQTNHLSDRELYQHLWAESLREEMIGGPLDGSSAYCIDILGGCSEQDMFLYLKYYADEKWRSDWAADFPEDEIPPHEDPPYDRDRLLPTAGF